jgi:hypothetical protein
LRHPLLRELGEAQDAAHGRPPCRVDGADLAQQVIHLAVERALGALCPFGDIFLDDFGAEVLACHPSHRLGFVIAGALGAGQLQDFLPAQRTVGLVPADHHAAVGQRVQLDAAGHAQREHVGIFDFDRLPVAGDHQRAGQRIGLFQRARQHFRVELAGGLAAFLQADDQRAALGIGKRDQRFGNCGRLRLFEKRQAWAGAIFQKFGIEHTGVFWRRIWPSL